MERKHVGLFLLVLSGLLLITLGNQEFIFGRVLYTEPPEAIPFLFINFVLLFIAGLFILTASETEVRVIGSILGALGLLIFLWTSTFLVNIDFLSTLTFWASLTWVFIGFVLVLTAYAFQKE